MVESEGKWLRWEYWMKGVYHAWLSPEGKFYEVREWGHEAFEFDWTSGENFGADNWSTLEDLGWIKLTNKRWYIWGNTPINQTQLDVIFDWCQANEFSAEWLKEIVVR